MIHLGLWLLVLGVSAAQADSITQQREGRCSPAVGRTEGNVTIIMNCPGVDPKVLQELNERYNKKDRELQEKKREAEEWARKYRELFQQAEASQDIKLERESKALLRKGKLEEADTLLGRSPISMAQYHAIQTGMSYPEVVMILGHPGVESGRSENPGAKVVNYLWQNPDGSAVAIIFINDRMSSKHQGGLR
jgi:hypothetical protein